MRLAALLLVCACVRSHEVPCGDGRVCPAGNTCDDTNHRCLSPEQTAACEGHAAGDGCALTGITGVCQGGVCEPLICGDGVRTGTESCDGSDLGGATCKTAGFYEPDGLACTPFCTFDTAQCKGSCGDGIVQTAELCDGAPPPATCVDDGFDAGALGCSVSCGASFARCGRFGWRAELTGLPSLTSLAGRASNDLWAAGAQNQTGMIGHYDGAGWTMTATLPGHPLNRIVEASPGEVWALDSRSAAPAVIRLVGGQPTVVTGVPGGAYMDLDARASNDVDVATRDIGVLHWNGATWGPVGALAPVATACSFCQMAIAGSGSADLWVAQTDGSVVHWDGTSWEPRPLDAVLRRVSAPAANDVWATGTLGPTGSGTGVIAHWTNGGWTTYAAGPGRNPQYGAILARADNDVWVSVAGGALTHFDGITWTPTNSNMSPTSAFNSFVAVGDQIIGGTTDGFVARYSGQLVARYDTTIIGGATTIWSARPDDTWLGNVRGEIWHFDGDVWSLAFALTTARIDGIFGTATTDVWAWGGKRIAHFDGSGWVVAPFTFFGVAVWGSSSTDMWSFGSTISHFDGTTSVSTFVLPTGTFVCASGSGPADVWAGTTSSAGTGEIYRWDGASWTLDFTAPAAITAIVVTAPGEVIAFADDMHAYHRHNGTWQATLLPAVNRLRTASATGPDDVFVASTTEIFHFDGARWTPVRAPSDPLVGADTIVKVDAHPGYVDLAYLDSLGSQQVRRILRTQPWECAATETACGDGVDNDCDGLVDGNDPDCP